MKILAVKIFVFLALIFILSSANPDELMPYAGVSASTQSIRFSEAYGATLFNHKALTPGLLGGVRVSPNIAIEASYGCSRAVKGVNCVGENRFLPGCQQAQATGSFQVLKTFIQTRFLNIGVIGFMQLTQKVKVGAGVGASLIHLKSTQELMYDNLPGIPPQDIVDLSRRTYKINSWVPSLTFYVEHMFHDNVSARVFVRWKRTSGLGSKSQEHPNRPAEIRLRNTTGVGLGLLYSF